MAFVVGEASFSSPPTAATPRSCTYDVFLSFRGEDTRKGFTGHLCAALEMKGITTFRDDKDLERGEVISSELLKAIEESMFAITVLSPNYASSAWCLDELQHIVECSQNMGLEVFPVFYGVEPSDVRYQKGSFEGAFKKHEVRFGQESEKIKRWKDSLEQIASYSGWDFKEDKHEASFVESIAELIHKKLIPKLPSCTKNLVGIDSRVEDVISLIGIGLNDVRFVGIWGMGGIGKTTTAKAVYDDIKSEFKVSCFVRNVREWHEKKKLVRLQRDILSCVKIKEDFSDEEEGRMMIKKSLCNKRVLLVLDDISEKIQLENLACEQDWFGPGSRIIITTRDMHLLRKHRVHETYEVKGLGEEDAHYLFCLKAFNQDKPKEEYSNLSKKVVQHTQGLPLAVDVLGSYLCEKNEDLWHSTITELMSGTHLDIVKVLRISVDRLNPTERGIFLDIACFFKGKKKDKVIHILKMCNFYVGIGSGIGSGIDTLIDKSLVTLNQDDNLEMHDLLQETGRRIVFEESSTNNPSERSRLWSKNDVDQVLRNDMGTDVIQSIALSSAYDDRWSTDTEVYQVPWSTKAFSRTGQLKFLRLYGILPFGFDYLPRSLKVFHWKRCPLEALPLANQSYEVVEMKLRLSNIKQLSHERKLLPMLKYLDLTRSYELKETPDVSALPILETLILKCCFGLIKVHSSLVDHKKLVLLNLHGCRDLKTLPGRLKMSSLKELNLSNCYNFKNLPEFGKCMKHLSTLSLDGTAITKLPTSIGYLVGLECLNLRECESLVGLPDTINQLKSLKILNACECNSLGRLPSSVSSLSSLSTLDLSGCGLSEESFPDDFCHLSSLTDLDLRGNPLASLPINIHKLPKIGRLSLEYRPNIQFFPELPSSTRELEALWCGPRGITQLISLSKSCDIIASSSSEPDCFISLLVPGSEIPSPYSYLHREDGNCVSLPTPRNDWLLNGKLGIVLIFLLETFNSSHGIPEVSLALYWNGERLATRTMSPEMGPGPYLYEFHLRSDCLSDEFQEGDIFELAVEGGPATCAKVLSSVADWSGKFRY